MQLEWIKELPDQGTNDIDRGPVGANAKTLFFFIFFQLKVFSHK